MDDGAVVAGAVVAAGRHARPRSATLGHACHAYAGPGVWLVTIDTVFAECLFGAVADKKMYLNELGLLAQRHWQAIPEHFPQAQLDSFVVMPNHVHGIVRIAWSDLRLTSAEDFKPRFGHPVPGSLGTILGAFKAVVTHDARQSSGSRVSIWQDGFDDRRLGTPDSLERARKYIASNPARWRQDYHARNGQPRTLCLPRVRPPDVDRDPPSDLPPGPPSRSNRRP